MSRTLVWIGAFVALVIGLAFYTLNLPLAQRGDPLPARWNNKALELHARCEKSSGRLTPLVLPYFEGREIDPEALDRAYLDYVSDAHIATRELGFLTPPDDPVCLRFQKTLGEYVEFQAAMTEEIGEIIEFMKETAPASVVDRQRMQVRFRNLGRRALALNDRLKADQRAVKDKYAR